jgi:hypothetical protein
MLMSWHEGIRRLGPECLVLLFTTSFATRMSPRLRAPRCALEQLYDRATVAPPPLPAALRPTLRAQQNLYRPLKPTTRGLERSRRRARLKAHLSQRRQLARVRAAPRPRLLRAGPRPPPEPCRDQRVATALGAHRVAPPARRCALARPLLEAPPPLPLY